MTIQLLNYRAQISPNIPQKNNKPTKALQNNKTNVSFASSPEVSNANKPAIIAKNELVQSAKKKITNYVKKVLENEVQLYPLQPLIIKANSEDVPFVSIMMKEAYKREAMQVAPIIKEPKLEELRKEYGAPSWDFKDKQIQELKSIGGAEVDYTDGSAYKKAGLTPQETKAIIETAKIKIPERIQKKLEINPKEIIDDILNLQNGQPIIITAQREHQPNVEKIVEYIYKTKGPVPVNVDYTERNPYNFQRLRLENASEMMLYMPISGVKEKLKEMIDKKPARLILYGEDPNALSGIPAEKQAISPANQKELLALSKVYSRQEYQWNIYHAPTTKSSVIAYPESNGDEIKALEMAAEDAPKLNRRGSFGKHVKTLIKRAEKLNELIQEKGVDTIHFLSVDPETKKPNGKTNLFVEMDTATALFEAAQHKTPNGVKYYPNTPTEEAFSSPHREKTHGAVSATKPLVINGNVIPSDFSLRFRNGKVMDRHTKAEKNEDILRNLIKLPNANMLGEVALVAGSPIGASGRIHYNTLLDENAACHIALGRGFPECVRGYKEVEGDEAKDQYLNEHGCNDSPTHNDFMIGGENVYVFGRGRDPKTGERIVIPIIKDDKFLL